MQISEWSCAEVGQWLKTQGFEEYCYVLCDVHGVDGDVLLSLTEKDLRNPPLQLQKLADIKKLGKCLKQIQEKSKLEKKSALNHVIDKDGRKQMNGRFTARKKRKQYQYNNSPFDKDSISSDIEESDAQCIVDSDGTEYCETVIYKKNRILPEYKKLLVSFGYAFVVSWITAYTMVLVHERVPDKQKHPPLPDIFLDNIPLMPFAFKLAELCGLILASFWMIILVFHKHRAILLRRFFSIASTIFLLRSCTMFVTSLSVPGEHLQCTAMYNSAWQRISRATEIVLGMGMTLTGVHSCGDYMFSGHTAYLTLFNHLITEYTPLRMYYIHTVSWVLNLFGVFFVLAAHEHYSIDVLIAFYVTSRIFLYYHMLANTRSYWHSKRIRIWFPLLSYFECNVPGKIPNEYEWPLSTDNLRESFKLVKSKTG
ncbi:unnamed protein product [Clavelina lepadiformis]|uniref:SAM domain-containing protein n=1 Tax=Clavelina lepadiformis TaxID=159417 RepID=A0ABP0EUK7_CLALP